MIEKIKLVQNYIYKMKGVSVDINTPNNLRDVMLLEHFYSIAKQYFNEKKQRQSG